MARPPIFPVVYALAARAPRLTASAFRIRLTTALANHYGALSCALHTDASGRAAASAELAPVIEELPRLDRAQIETIEAQLVRKVVEEGYMCSALNLDDGVEVDAFLKSRLGEYDIFAFPLKTVDGPFAVLVLYLGEESRHLGEEDLPALNSLGHLFSLVGTGLGN
ncbi:MAG: hypothetical protein GY946_29985 [bacterium]|nr:hypothetical protein [bacterium]